MRLRGQRGGQPIGAADRKRGGAQARCMPNRRRGRRAQPLCREGADGRPNRLRGRPSRLEWECTSNSTVGGVQRRNDAHSLHRFGCGNSSTACPVLFLHFNSTEYSQYSVCLPHLPPHFAKFKKRACSPTPPCRVAPMRWTCSRPHALRRHRNDFRRRRRAVSDRFGNDSDTRRVQPPFALHIQRPRRTLDPVRTQNVYPRLSASVGRPWSTRRTTRHLRSPSRSRRPRSSSPASASPPAPQCPWLRHARRIEVEQGMYLSMSC